jgi:hypothetical protein
MAAVPDGCRYPEKWQQDITNSATLERVAPYAWLLLIDYPWNSYRRTWVGMWPVLPGLLVHAIRAVHQQPERVGYLAMGLVTASIVAPIALVSRRSRRAAMIVSLAVLVLSGVNSWLAYQLFLA